VSAVDAGLGGCSRRRCRRTATTVVSFQAPHPLAGTSRGYCPDDAVLVADQPGAVLTGAVGHVPVQPAPARPRRACRTGLAAAAPGCWAVTAARSVPADPAGAKQRHRVRALAKQRAAAWLARAHPEEYRECYAVALERVRAQAPGLLSWRARERAAGRARADLQALFPDEYQARVQAELAELEPAKPVEVGRVEWPVAARARLRALLWLADRHPEQTKDRFQAEAARLPLHPADRSPGRRRTLAWVRALEGLRCLFPEEFQARYLQELARHAGQGWQP
jgi:hypothetical protein